MPPSLKGRGVVSDTPVYEAGTAAAPGAAPRRTSGAGGGGKGDAALQNYLTQRAYDGSQLAEELSLLGAVRHAAENGGTGGFAYASGNKERFYQPVLRPNEAMGTALKRISENTGMTPDEIVTAAGGQERLEQMMANNQKVAGSHHLGIVKSAGNAARGIGADLVSEDDAQQLLALKALGLERDALASRFGTAPPPSAPADIGMPDWIPRMDNLSPVQTGMAYGALAAGTGAAGLALVNHLIAQGQQQANPVEYAAAMQALNAYA
jgi:hypothetical protein